MLHLDLHDDKHNKVHRLGTVGDFIKEVVAEMHTAKVTSRIFSRQANQADLDREFAFALDRVIQKRRDDL